MTSVLSPKSIPIFIYFYFYLQYFYLFYLFLFIFIYLQKQGWQKMFKRVRAPRPLVGFVA